MGRHCDDGALGGRFDLGGGGGDGLRPVGAQIVELWAAGSGKETWIWDAATGVAGVGPPDPDAPYDPMAGLYLLVNPPAPGVAADAVEVRFAPAASVTRAAPRAYGGIPVVLSGAITHLELENLSALTVHVSLWPTWGRWQTGRHDVFSGLLGVSWIDV